MNARKDMDRTEDPRLTAYALGELEASEVAAVEALLREDDEARRVVDEVRATARLLEAELSREEGAGLTSAQRGAIESAAESAPKRRRRLSFTARVALAAASLLVTATAATWVLHRRSGESGYAYNIIGSGPPVAESRRSRARAPERELQARLETVQEEVFQDAEEPDSAWLAEADVDPPELALEVESNTEAYDRIVENPFHLTRDAPLSTFSIDVDTASYANVRRFLTAGGMPPPDAVRIEELVNYFPYAYDPPTDERPFAVHVETADCPWAPRHRLLRIGLQGRAIGEEGRKPSNLVFLLDVSGSMNEARKLPLLKSALQMLVQELDERDRVAIVVYAGAAGLVLPSTSAGEKWAISEALERLEAGGSTAGGAGIELAYSVAVDGYIEGGVNRVILATDGDFNVGVSDDGSLTRLIEEKRETGVFLSVLGFGTGNLKDAKLEKLADSGNGNYAYIDGPLEARKVLVEELGATLETIAKDVKIQLELNPLEVEGYRLIGYENRLLAARDFDDDAKDAGEIGAGHSVTALYELVPAGVGLEVPGVDPLRYQTPPQPSGAAFSGELLTLKLRYKEPDGSESRLIEIPVRDTGGSFGEASEDLRFASAVAAFGMLLRGSEHAGDARLDDVLRWANESVGADRGGYRRELVGLVRKAIAIGGR